MNRRILIACAAGVLACEPSPIIVVQAPPSQTVACVQPRTYALADFESTDPTAAKRRACDDVVRACAAGGYYSGGMDVGRGVLVDCLAPLQSGKIPARVDVDPRALYGCFGPNLDDKEGDTMATDRASVLAPPPFRNPRRR
jgi:hypothetical protein